MENDILICNCNEIYKSAIVKAIKEKGNVVKNGW